VPYVLGVRSASHEETDKHRSVVADASKWFGNLAEVLGGDLLPFEIFEILLGVLAKAGLKSWRFWVVMVMAISIITVRGKYRAIGSLKQHSEEKR